MRLRHLHFVQSLEPLQGGGLGSAALQLHNQIASVGSSKLVATRAADFQTRWEQVEQYVRMGPASVYFSKDLAKHASALVREADWIHAHGLYVFSNWVLGAQARKQEKPLACHVHGFFNPWILRRSRMKKALVSFLFESKNLHYANFFRALTVKESRQIRHLGFTQPIEVVPNGISLEEVDAEPVAVDSATPHLQTRRPKRLLFLSRLHPVKGLEMLVTAWATLSREFPDWELVIVGPNEGGHQKEVQDLIDRFDLNSTCVIHGAVSGQLKHDVYRSADRFVLPSHSEGFPMAILEALAHRVPTVLTTECNFPELAEQGIAWECLPEGRAIEHAIRESLLADEAECTDRANRGRQLVESEYSWDKIVQRLEEACMKYA